MTVLAGLIAKHFGPVVGGLFLAFPAIFPASATLLDRDQREKKRRAGIPATLRGRLAVALDARGAAIGMPSPWEPSRFSYGGNCRRTLPPGCWRARSRFGWPLPPASGA